MVLVIALAGVDNNQVVLDGALHTAWHVVIDSRQFDGHADDLVFAKQGTALTLHLRIAEVDTGDIEALLSCFSQRCDPNRGLWFQTDCVQ